MGFSNHTSDDEICLSQISVESLELAPFWGSKLGAGIKVLFSDIFMFKILLIYGIIYDAKNWRSKVQWHKTQLNLKTNCLIKKLKLEITSSFVRVFTTNGAAYLSCFFLTTLSSLTISPSPFKDRCQNTLASQVVGYKISQFN